MLAELPAEEVRRLLAIARRRRFSKGEVVFHQHDPADSLHLVAKGRFAVRVMTPVGDVVTVAVRGVGENFGEMALVDDKPRSATVAALEESETFAVHRDDFARLRREHPSVERILLAFLTAEVRTLSERLLEALFMPVEKRVRRRLLGLAEIYPGDDGRPLVTLTQEAIAELAGASRATVNEVLRAEEAHGTLELSRGRTRILDLETLRRRAQ